MATPEDGYARYFVCGGVAGICCNAIGHPFDTLKVRMQTMMVGKDHRFHSMTDCVRRTIAKEGYAGFYKGMLAPVLITAPMFSARFVGYNVGNKLFVFTGKSWEYFLAGSLTSLFTSPIVAPIERVKCLLQIQRSAKETKFKGPFDAFRKTYKQGGIEFLYRGTVITVAREAIGCGGYFASYEYLKMKLTKNDVKNMSVWTTLVSGGAAGMVYWISALPVDIVKNKYQVTSLQSKKTVLTITRSIYEMDGLLGFYRGFAPVIIRSFLANAGAFVGFEYSNKFINYLYLNIT